MSLVPYQAYRAIDLLGLKRLPVAWQLSRLKRRFVSYWSESAQYRSQLDANVIQSTVQNFSAARYGELWLPVPSLEEQSEIVSFLERETAKIDALVAEQRRLMELLQEKRQAIIFDTVTKGLNPDAPMKPSGVEWLGGVPAHWVVGALKRFWSVTDCKHITAEFVDEGYPVVSIREVQGRWVSLSEAKRTTEHYYSLLTEGGRQPEPGDLIFSRNATVGEVAQVPLQSESFAMGQDVVLLRRRSAAASPDYLQFAIRSPVVMQQLALLVIGSTFKRINVAEIASLVVPYPPVEEQHAIANHLRERVDRIDDLLATAREGIVFLEERRAALISAAVTGQIDVRNLAAAEAA